MNLKTCLYGFISLGFIRIKLSTGGPIENNHDKCVRCENFNRQRAIPCPNSYRDCGQCKQGFTETDEDPRVCTAIEILEDPPETVKQLSTSDVHLPCKFNNRVYCAWERNGQHVDIGGKSRYQFDDKNANKNLKVNDCSINIRHLSKNDAGEWQCSNEADSNSDFIIKSKVSFISIVSGHPLIEFNGENVTGSEIQSDHSLRSNTMASYDNKLIVNCLTDAIPTELTWRIDNMPVQGRTINATAIQVDLNQLQNVNFTDANLECIAKYSGGIEKISSVKLRNDNRSMKMSTLSGSPSTTPEIDAVTARTVVCTPSAIPKWVVNSIIIIVIMMIILSIILFLLLFFGCRQMSSKRVATREV